ncbi:hypothetical protein P7C70_g1681, partial [Phenoliferia sp. Uapishka_3]
MAHIELEKQVKPLTGPLVPLLPPIVSSRQLPTLQLERSDAPFGTQHPTWQRQTYVVPAAFPRSISGSTAHPDNQIAGGDAAPQRVDVAEALLKMFVPQSDALKKEVDVESLEEYQDQEQLFLAVNRYRCTERRTSNKMEPGLTLVFLHANGFHKEIWEPTIADLLEKMKHPEFENCRPIEEVWTLDCVNQGDSAILNEAVLGNTFSWADHGRDIINFLLSYIDSPSLRNASSPSGLHPTLSPVTDVDTSLFLLDAAPHPNGPSPASLRLWRNKLIVGIGHSLGGGGTAFAATAIPSIFSSVIFCDPVLPPLGWEKSTSALTGGALIRRDGWASRQDAMEAFLKKAFFRNWDPRVLDRYIVFGLKDVAEGVKLKARPRDEALVFGDCMASSARRAHSRLHTIPAALPVHFIFAEEGRSVLEENDILELVAQVKHASFSRVAGAGHLVAQERPKETAEEIASFLRETYTVEPRAKL